MSHRPRPGLWVVVGFCVALAVRHLHRSWRRKVVERGPGWEIADYSTEGSPEFWIEWAHGRSLGPFSSASAALDRGAFRSTF